MPRWVTSFHRVAAATPVALSSAPKHFTARPGTRGPSRHAVDANPELGVSGCVTLYELFRRTCAEHAEKPAVGWRPLDAAGEAGPFKWLTYKELRDRADAFGAGVEALGLCSANEDGMRLLGFYAKNRLEWNLAEQGCYSRSIIPVPMYDTLGADSVEYVVEQTGLTAVACTTNLASTLLEVASRRSSLRTLLLMDGEAAAIRGELASLRKAAAECSVDIYTFGEVEAAGAGDSAKTASPPNPQDVAFFCYTSGTTGNPKGALITHQGILSSLAAIQSAGLKMYPDDVHLSYLPLPHVFERAVQAAVVEGGGSIGYYQGEPLKILEDLAALRPTIFPSVPRLLNRVYDKVIAGVEEAGGIKAWLFNKALASKVANLRMGHLTHAIWDRLVFNGLKAKLGLDRVRMMVTGSAPIAPHVMDFLRAAFGVPVLEGYGQTESSCVITITSADDFSVGHVGAPAAVNEIMLEDVPEMGYLSTDTDHNGLPCLGRGEICFRGPNVFAGYYKMPEKTRSAIDADGWCHTGDIGLWTPEGKLKIIDRKKNIFKLAQGEYVAAEKIENIIARSSYVLQSFVYGDSLKSKLVAIIVIDPECPAVTRLGTPLDQLCSDSGFVLKVLKDIKAQCKEAALKGFEIPRAIFLEHEAFSVDNGILTPTFKLKRPVARDHYRAHIDSLYLQLEGGATPSKL